MGKDQKEQSMKAFSSDILRGKPYLDIDRVIPEGKSKNNNRTAK
ncbi:hypothetical protein [Oceanobacillus senegalensis]|nr:hypothetical protein [Oceanobacillus senegalensis]